MRATSLLRTLLNLKQTKVVGFEFSDSGLVVDVAPTTRLPRCSRCGRPCRRGYDARTRRWRHLDFAGMEVVLRYRIRRVECDRCGVTTELVPWAEPAAWFTRDFEDTVALLAQRTDKTTITELMGISWQTVGSIIARVVERRGPTDLLDGVTHIGIDEISYRRHHHYLTIVTDHIRGRVIWAGVGRTGETLGKFFDELGAERTLALEVVSVDMCQAYIDVVRQRAPEAELVFDRFHVQRLAHNALDEVRRSQVRELKGTEEGQALKKTRWALQKNPWNLTTGQHQKLAEVQRVNRPLYRAYLLKETLCDVLDRSQVNVARQKLHEWLAWAYRSRLEPFQKLAGTIKRHLEGIVAYVRTKASNGRSEGMNNKLRTVTQRAYGFHGPSPLLGYIRLCCSGLDIPPVRHYPAVRG